MHVYIYMFSLSTYPYIPTHMTYWNPLSYQGPILDSIFVCLVSEHGIYIHKFNDTRGVSLDMELLHFDFDCVAIIL